MAEERLAGGLTNAGEVRRIGGHVLRPGGAHTESLHGFLSALRAAGFEGAPMPIGIESDGRERLEFVEGDAPLVPYPAWSQSDVALASVARLLRELHDASQVFDPSGRRWKKDLADPVGGPVVCHNDVEPSNVIFRGGSAVAFVDFEFAAPGRPVYDVAHLVRLWAPIDDEVDRVRLGWQTVDGPRRARIIADAYGLDRAGRAELLSALEDAIDTIEQAVVRGVADGDQNTVALWNATGGMERYRRRRRWWARHQRHFAASLA